MRPSTRNTQIKDPKSASLVVYDPTKDLAPPFQNLHLTLQDQAAQRQKGVTFLNKTKWELYEKKKFDSMIEEINGFIGKLVELFPATLVFLLEGSPRFRIASL
jgi:hypothetical protein